MLEQLSRELNMTLVYPPLVAAFPFAHSELERYTTRLIAEGITTPTVSCMLDHVKKRANEQSGVSGIAIWLESHASIHTWPEELYFAIDLFSCKEFDYVRARKLIIDMFNITKFSGCFLKRGNGVTIDPVIFS